MPHPGTHVTVVQRLAAENAAFSKLLGAPDPNLTGTNKKEVMRLKYASLGAIGPDLFYFLLDGGDETMMLQDFVVRLGASFHALSRIDSKVGQVASGMLEANKDLPCEPLSPFRALLGEAIELISLAVNIVSSTAAGIAVGGTGFNAFRFLPSPRQAGDPQTKWYWADFLHYVRSGKFAETLVKKSSFDPKYKSRPELLSYSLGYLTHYVADTIGHPYVNQIVLGGYRLHRQRHTLVENCIDGIVWNRWHVKHETEAHGSPFNPLTGDRFFHHIRNPAAPFDGNVAGEYRNCRLDLQIDIGSMSGSLGPIEKILDGLADLIEKGTDTAFLTSSVPLPDNETFNAWAELMVDSIKEVYGNIVHPQILPNGGFVTTKDVKVAYMTTCFVLRLSTNGGPEEPKLDTGQFAEDVQEFIDALKKSVGKMMDALDIPPPQMPSGKPNPKKFLKDLLDWLEDVGEAAVAVVKAAVEVLEQLCTTLGKLTADVVRAAIFFIRKPLWTLYQALCQVLELRAYAQPHIATVHEYTELWLAPGNKASTYPIMELIDDEGIVQDQIFNDYVPNIAPTSWPANKPELPLVNNIAQNGARMTPDDLLDAPMGPINMFTSGGPRKAAQATFANPNGGSPATLTTPSFEDIAGQPVLYGGILDNCRFVLNAIAGEIGKPGAKNILPSSLTLPNYNLDGDRGIGWPGWDVKVGTTLRPADMTKTAVVSAEKIPD